MRPGLGRCAGCRNFRNDADSILLAFPGLSAMGSVGADVRAGDGLCSLHGVYLSFSDRCAQFSATARPEGEARFEEELSRGYGFSGAAAQPTVSPSGK
jgi:hypothetical protein